ncbi:MAG TPA: alpha/beta hydrolase [Actinomycetota bacterium]|jgi:pimeloyl-ACP methyl ester carboxylesterase|nr:alpha/beta hydrolase [Actinomycetota bacterium]
METKRITANGIEFAYLEQGEGPLVLCLHGFPDHAPTWEPLLGALAKAGFRGVAPWTRGYPPTGASPDGKYHSQYQALDALALTDALAGNSEIYIVGSDWGAGAATLAVTHKPDRFKKIVTLAVPPQGALSGFLESPEQWKRSWYIWFFNTPLADIAFPAKDFAIIDRIWADWSPGYQPDAAFMRSLRDCFAADGGQAAMGYYRDSFHGRSAAEGEAAQMSGGAVPIPMLYFHGRDDGCLGIDLIDETILKASLGPGGEYVFVEGAGHFLHLEKPDEVNAKIVEFLKA